eukprot:scaffold13221_cov100-Isochrysis_galbana.AAC.6
MRLGCGGQGGAAWGYPDRTHAGAQDHVLAAPQPAAASIAFLAAAAAVPAAPARAGGAAAPAPVPAAAFGRPSAAPQGLSPRFALKQHGPSADRQLPWGGSLAATLRTPPGRALLDGDAAASTGVDGCQERPRQAPPMGVEPSSSAGAPAPYVSAGGGSLHTSTTAEPE